MKVSLERINEEGIFSRIVGTVYLPSVSVPNTYKNINLFVGSDGSTYYDKALTKLARSCQSHDCLVELE